MPPSCVYGWYAGTDVRNGCPPLLRSAPFRCCRRRCRAVPYPYRRPIVLAAVMQGIPFKWGLCRPCASGASDAQQWGSTEASRHESQHDGSDCRPLYAILRESPSYIQRHTDRQAYVHNSRFLSLSSPFASYKEGQLQHSGPGEPPTF